jgi:hypothetical protein
MNVMALGLALMVSSSGVSPANEIPRAMVVPAAFTFDLPPTDALGPPWRSTSVLQPSPPRDSLKNGAIIGAIIGAATGACMAAFGCAIVKETGRELRGIFNLPGRRRHRRRCGDRRRSGRDVRAQSVCRPPWRRKAHRPPPQVSVLRLKTATPGPRGRARSPERRPRCPARRSFVHRSTG